MQDFIAWQQQRVELFKENSQHDTDSEIKKQAGIETLNDYSNYYEIEFACKLFNCSQIQLFEMDDAFVTKMLLSKKISSNFESRYLELKKK